MEVYLNDKNKKMPKVNFNMSIKKKKIKNNLKEINDDLFGQLICTSPEKLLRVKSKYPSTMSNSLIEHILTWMNNSY